MPHIGLLRRGSKWVSQSVNPQSGRIIIIIIIIGTQGMGQTSSAAIHHHQPQEKQNAFD